MDTLDTTPAEQPAMQRLLVMDEWDGAQFDTALDASGEVYLPVRSLCKYLGIESQMQIRALRKRRNMQRYMRRFWITAARGGRQAAWCLHIRAVAFWLGGYVDVELVRPELQDGLLEWQDTLIQAAHALFFGHFTEYTNELTQTEVLQRLNVAELEIRRLKMVQRIQARRLASVERHALPNGTYYDLPDEPEE